MTGQPTIRKSKQRIQVLPSQLRFLESGARSKGFSGPVGSGKTHALCWQALRSESVDFDHLAMNPAGVMKGSA